MGVPHLDQGPMTADEFVAFAETRPDEEKWELIDGAPVLNATAGRLHQKILLNLSVALAERSRGAAWEILPGFGVRLSKISVPVPDLVIRPNATSRASSAAT